MSYDANGNKAATYNLYILLFINGEFCKGHFMILAYDNNEILIGN